MNQELEKVFSAEELSKSPDGKSIGFIGKSGRLVAVTTILTFSRVGPLSHQAMAQNANTEVGIVSKQSDAEDQFVITIAGDDEVPSWLQRMKCEYKFCSGDFSSCVLADSLECLLGDEECPSLYCNMNFDDGE